MPPSEQSRAALLPGTIDGSLFDDVVDERGDVSGTMDAPAHAFTREWLDITHGISEYEDTTTGGLLSKSPELRYAMPIDRIECIWIQGSVLEYLIQGTGSSMVLDHDRT